MEPGLEFDQHIAELLGWRNIDTRGMWVEDLHDTYLKTYLEGIPPEADNPVSTGVVPEFSTNTDAALMLFEGEDIRWTLSGTPPEKTNGDRYRCEIQDNGYHIGYGDTTALAICKAWMKWKSDH